MAINYYYTIKCEQDAWEILEKYHKNPPKKCNIKLENFECFKYYINGSKYNTTLNTDMMSSIILLQQTIYRRFMHCLNIILQMQESYQKKIKKN